MKTIQELEEELEEELEGQYIDLSELDSSIKEAEEEIEYQESLIDDWQDERKPLLIEIKSNELQLSILKGETTLGQLEALKDNQTISLL